VKARPVRARVDIQEIRRELWNEAVDNSKYLFTKGIIVFLLICFQDNIADIRTSTSQIHDNGREEGAVAKAGGGERDQSPVTMETDCPFIGAAGKFNLEKKCDTLLFKFIFWEYSYESARVDKDFSA
jgi:hypothetical protein